MARTLRRRFIKSDGTSAGWLILSTDQLADLPAEPLNLSEATADPRRRADPPQAAIPHPR